MVVGVVVEEEEEEADKDTERQMDHDITTFTPV